MSGWKPGARQYLHTHELFVEIWRKLQDDCDENFDGKITTDEWVSVKSSFSVPGHVPFFFSVLLGGSTVALW